MSGQTMPKRDEWPKQSGHKRSVPKSRVAKKDQCPKEMNGPKRSVAKIDEWLKAISGQNCWVSKRDQWPKEIDAEKQSVSKRDWWPKAMSAEKRWLTKRDQLPQGISVKKKPAVEEANGAVLVEWINRSSEWIDRNCEEWMNQLKFLFLLDLRSKARSLSYTCTPGMDS